MRLFAGCLALALLLAAAGRYALPIEPAPVVHLSSGSLRGALNQRTATFMGIPFAAPPVGSLRWREPQPVIAWKGLRDATKPGSACTQPSIGLGGFIGPLMAAYGARSQSHPPVASSEDCLYLNVWTPGWPGRTGLPVMVWLHGGSNIAGSGSQPDYDGSSLAAHGVIVVTINYRLGVMGFFAHPELTAESPHHSSGNYGLLDQIAALQWVRQNIQQFGGDPQNVTLFGESAGSIDATTLMTSPLAYGLFRRVIAESGTAFGLGPVETLAQSMAVGDAVGKTLGGSEASELQELRKLPAADVIRLYSQVVGARFKGFDTSAPVVDGWLLPQSPAKAFASGAIQKVDLLAGLNARELSAFRIAAAAAAKQPGNRATTGGVMAAAGQLADRVRPLYGAWTDLAVAMYAAQVLLHGDQATDQASNDMLVACPVGAEAALTTSAGRHAFLYEFRRSIPGKGQAALGSFHGLEIPYVFNTFTASDWSWLPFTATDHQIERLMETYWTNFAKSGDPNSSGLPAWKQWNAAQQPYLDFTQDGTAVAQQDFAPPFCHLAPNRLKQQLDR